MKKKIYILETRKPLREVGLIPNTTVGIVGVFSSPKKAIAWIKENTDWFSAKDWEKKRLFWALVGGTVDADDLVLYGFYDKNGKIKS